MKQKKVWAALAAMATISIALAGCDQDYQGKENTRSGNRLNISVGTAEVSKTRALVEGRTLPNKSSIGIFLTEEGAVSYDRIQYNNIQWTARGEGLYIIIEKYPR